MAYTFAQYQESADYIKEKIGGFVPKVAMVLGSGLGFLGDIVETPTAIPYGEIPHFKASTAPGHKGQLVFGVLAGKNVAVMQGRMHHYEGYGYDDVSYAVRVLRLLGCDTLIVTNAAGCVRTDWQAGDLMLITDHIKMFSESPLRGANIPEFGVRFPDASHLYTPRLQQIARETAADMFINLREGVYFYCYGPSTRPPPRSGRPVSWAATRWVCPPPPRSSWRGTAAWRCWASPCCPTWRRAFWTSPSAKKRCWMPPRPPRINSPGWCWAV